MSKKEEEKEKFDDSKDVAKKAKDLADLISKSKHVVFHCGAGISTSASIPDFRGPKGVWTLQDKGEEPQFDVEFEEAVPTLSHMALVELQNKGFIKYIVSQNVDGLFLRSGIHTNKLSELHGNVYLEICRKCGHQYLRDFDAALDGKDNHDTGRYCTQQNCAGKLRDSIINFGEQLPKKDMDLAIEHSKKADLSIVLGSSLKVTPACDFPELTLKNGGKVAVVNLMDTYLDSKCSVRIYAKIDDVLKLVMKELGLSIPSFELKVNVWIGNTAEKVKKGKRAKENWKWTLHVAGDCGYQSHFLHKAEILLPKTMKKKPKKEETKEWITMDGGRRNF